MERPVLIFDGTCGFCRRWIARWQAVTGDRVEYVASQDLGGRFPEFSAEDFSGAVCWAGLHGERFTGARAVFASLAVASRIPRWLLRLYEHSPHFADVADGIYGIVSRNRGVFSKLTALAWGDDVRPPTYAVSGAWFVRGIAAIYLIAFVSFLVQARGLVGANGILPAQAFFARAGAVLGPDGFWLLPSVCWWGASDAVLCGLSLAGAVVSALVLAGIAPLAGLVFLWGAYLSLSVAGQDFYRFQWDLLLLEAGFLAIFLAPSGWRHRAGNPPRLARLLVIWLLFRLMFCSGVVKLTSGDPAWSDGSALEFHYFTQPLPTPLAWFAAQLPGWWQFFSVKVMFFIELVLPFFLFGPRHLRLGAAAGLVLLQVLIAATGNYGFFNALTVVLCLLAVDDAVWRRWLPFAGLARPGSPVAPGFLSRWIIIPVAGAIFALSLVPLVSSFRRPVPWIAPLARAYDAVAPFRTINGYGLFAVMTTERREILVQGSEDGFDWKTYTFRFKPGDPRRAPPWVAPYMPRLDWQMWFAALGHPGNHPWFEAFLRRLGEGSPAVLGLLEHNPFPDRPPRFLRALSDRYTFTTWAEWRAGGDWWHAEPAAIYYPEVAAGGR
ncbi:MAG TPA: lipase maturation factor family protein [Terrimicrobiaceae bacterium]|nr:lipase maturation factor family protein [Terrimicrobiaceae bacterium]